MAAQIKTDLDKVHGDTPPTLKTIYFWNNEFKRDRMLTKDETRPGSPVEATAPEMIKNIHHIVMEDRRINLRQVAEIFGISVSAVHNILHEKLEMKEMCARWVPRLLTIDEKRTRKDISEQCLTMLKRDVHWVAPGENAPKKAKTVSSTDKMVATIFWGAQGIILIDYTG